MYVDTTHATPVSPAAICGLLQDVTLPAIEPPTEARYEPTAEVTNTINEIIYIHRLRQAVLRAKTKVILQYKAVTRSILCTEADYEEDTSSERVTAYGRKPRKLSKAAAKRVDAAVEEAMAECAAAKEAEARGEPTPEMSDLARHMAMYFESEQLFESQNKAYEKQLVRLAKQLPVYRWVKGVHGFGDVSFATIVGECGDLGTYKTIAAVWKRLGLAVIDGNRQGRPGEGAKAEDWERHGYNRKRRSVSWNARNGLIGAGGKWRPEYGVELDPDTMTKYQMIFVSRARLEAERLALPVECSKTGKESYKKHVLNRAARHMEKCLIRDLVKAWKRAA